MSWLMAVMFCITNAPVDNTKDRIKGCVKAYAQCVGSPGRRDKACEIKVLEYHKEKKSGS